MKAGFTTLSKLLAICVFLGLLSGYVWYRHDAALKSEEQRIAAQKAIEKTRENKLKEEGLVLDEATLQELKIKMFSSSKSGGVMMPSTKNAMVMPSSKSGMMSPGLPVWDGEGEIIDMEKLRKENPELHKKLERLLKEAKGQRTDAAENSAKNTFILPSSKSGRARLDDIPQLKELFIEEPHPEPQQK